MYRWPGLLAKTMKTLDVLSAGRARLGIELVEVTPAGPDPIAFVSTISERVVPSLAEIGTN